VILCHAKAWLANMDPESLQRLDKIARLHAERYGHRGVVPLNASGKIRAQLFARWVGTGKRLLEVGCGSGAHLEYYCRGNDVVAMDVDQPALEVVRERLGVHTIWGDFATTMPFDDGRFDTIVAGETLEHMPYPTIFLAEVRRVLRPGGVFVGSVPNAYRYRNRLDVLRGRPIDRDPVHVQFFSLASLRAILARDFEAIEIVPVRGKWSHRFPSLFAHNLAWRCRRPASPG
jgi:SAM-dependent methyltransferase